jgi:integrase
VSLRDIRHCAPTLALAGGEDIKVVSAMMRHTSVKVTADVYALVLPDLAASVSRSVASMIPRAVQNL